MNKNLCDEKRKEIDFSLITCSNSPLMAEEQLEVNATTSGIQSCCNCVDFTVKL